MASIIGGTRGLNRSLDRISSGIYENAVTLHRQEHRQLARWAALVQFREKIADLKEAFKARQTYLEASIPPLVRTMIDLSALKEPSAHTSAPATSFAIGKAA